MFELPASTELNRVIPQNKLFANAITNNALLMMRSALFLALDMLITKYSHLDTKKMML